ncbi:ABC transporter ATP-binding protein, partial [Vibrio sp. 10N.222.54.F6]
PTGYIALTLLLVILMRTTSQALNILQGRQFTLVSKTITYQMRSKMIDKLGRISIRQYETKGSGGINAHLITDIET